MAESVPEPRLQPPGLKATAQQIHERLSPAPPHRAASCPPAYGPPSADGRRVGICPVPSSPAGFDGPLSGPLLAAQWLNWAPKPRPDSGLSHHKLCALEQVSVLLWASVPASERVGEEPVRVVGGAPGLSHEGPCSASLGLATSLGIVGKSQNREPRFPHLSNVVLNQRLWKLSPRGHVLSASYSNGQNFELAETFKKSENVTQKKSGL